MLPSGSAQRKFWHDNTLSISENNDIVVVSYMFGKYFLCIYAAPILTERVIVIEKYLPTTRSVLHEIIMR